MNRLAQSGLRKPHSGGVLVIFAFLVFGLMAIAALVIDLGMASATQGQMQSAVDVASLESLRWRNTTNSGIPDHIEVLPFFTDDNRRERAADYVALCFDDDLDLSNGDAAGYSVGPQLSLTGGVGDSDASALINLESVDELDNPQVEYNRGSTIGFNNRTGDLVAGAFDSAANHGEGDDYVRADFVPALNVEGSRNSEAFLVRMRRTSEEAVPGVSWVGPTIPYLFGRGSLIGASAEYSPRATGLEVRATAIATAQPALQVGATIATEPRIRGVASFALDNDRWASIDVTLNDPECVEIAGGELFLVGDPVPIGAFVQRVTAVGQRILPDAAPLDTDSLLASNVVWVPIYSEIDNGAKLVKRVIGFVYAELQNPDNGGCAASELSFSKRASDVASHNASALFPQNAEQLTKSEWTQIFERRRAIDQPLLAPAISR